MQFSSTAYAWPLLTNFFTEALSRDDWLKLADHLFIDSQEPELLIYFATALLLSSKSQLVQIGCVQELHAWLHRPNCIPFKKIMTLAKKLHAKYKTSVYTGNFASSLPLCSEPSSNYQPFVRYPEHFVTFQT
jgi:hypothetical protein